MDGFAAIDAAFRWQVWPQYVWVRGTRVPSLLNNTPQTEERFLVYTLTHRKGGTVGPREYQPLKEFNGLFATFANTAVTEAGILAFAEQYGNLTGSKPAPFIYRQPNGESVEWFGESLDQWKYAIETMRQLLEKFEEARPDELGEPKSWATASTEVRGGDDLETLLRSRVLEGYQRANLVYNFKTTRIAIAHDVNLQLATGAMTWGLLPRLQMDESAERGRLLFLPTTLKDAMWLQFADALCSGASFRCCKTCETTYYRVLRHRADQPIRQTCSRRCDMKARREDQREVRRLRDDDRLSAADIGHRMSHMTAAAIETALRDDETSARIARRRRGLKK